MKERGRVGFGDDRDGDGGFDECGLDECGFLLDGIFDYFNDSPMAMCVCVANILDIRKSLGVFTTKPSSLSRYFLEPN